MSPFQYPTIFIVMVTICTIVYSKGLSGKSYFDIEISSISPLPALLLTAFLSLWVGLREVHYSFGDMVLYAHVFNLMKFGELVPHVGDNEYIWAFLTYFCANNYNINIYFAIISVGYFGFVYWACQRWFSKNAIIAFLFFIGGFSCWGYAVNGIRNGLACSIVIAVLSLVSSEQNKVINYIFAVILGFIACNIHKTTMLPLFMMVLSWRFIKSFHWAYKFWILSIVFSLITGNFFINVFSSLGFDDRESYLTSTADSDQFSHTGFRFDFLLYSMMPIVLGYFIVIKRGIEDKTYLLLLNTYTLSNAFWVMVIRASFSNRFAYLSWFMYPIVLAYPLLKLDIWGEEQGEWLYKILWAHLGFTLFMFFVY